MTWLRPLDARAKGLEPARAGPRGPSGPRTRLLLAQGAG